MITIQFRICTHTRMWRITTLLRYPTIHLPTTNTLPCISQSQSLGSHIPPDYIPLDLTTLDLLTVLWTWSLPLHFPTIPVFWIYCLLNKVTLQTTSPVSTQSSGSTHSPGSTQSSGPSIFRSTFFQIYSFFWIYTTLHYFATHTLISHFVQWVVHHKPLEWMPSRHCLTKWRLK